MCVCVCVCMCMCVCVCARARVYVCVNLIINGCICQISKINELHLKNQMCFSN